MDALCVSGSTHHSVCYPIHSMAVILTDKTGNESAMVISFCREKRQGNRMWEKEGSKYKFV